jgi:hypothetical protein
MPRALRAPARLLVILFAGGRARAGARFLAAERAWLIAPTAGL